MALALSDAILLTMYPIVAWVRQTCKRPDFPIGIGTLPAALLRVPVLLLFCEGILLPCFSSQPATATVHYSRPNLHVLADLTGSQSLPMHDLDPSSIIDAKEEQRSSLPSIAKELHTK